MKHLRLLIFLLLVQPLWADQPLPNAVLISCDGLGRDVLKELLTAGKLPAFAALIQEGSLQEIEVKGHHTSTVPGHATLLTGYLSDVHGLSKNSEIRSIPAGLSVFERLEQHLGATNIATIMVAGKERNLGGDCTNDVYFLTRQHIDYFNSKDRVAADVVKLALPVLAKRPAQRFFVFLHFRDPDTAGHSFGKDSPQHRVAIEHCDRALAQVVEWLRKEQLTATTRIYITADHGFDDHSFSHSDAPHIFLATNDKAVKHGGNQADIPATILTRLGVDISPLQPPLAGRSLTK